MEPVVFRGVALIGILWFSLSGCGSAGDSPVATAACGADGINVPAPVVSVGDSAQPMDLVFARGCGIEADGAAGLGADPVLVSAADEIQVAASDKYDLRYALSPIDSFDGELDRAESTFVVPIPNDGCHLLTVDLDGGEVDARFAARVASIEGACLAET